MDAEITYHNTHFVDGINDIEIDRRVLYNGGRGLDIRIVCVSNEK